MQFERFFQLCIVLLVFLPRAQAFAADQKAQPAPLWTVDLTEQKFQCGENEMFWVTRLQCGAFFDGDDHVIVYFATPSKEPTLGNRITGGAYRLTVLRYAASNGAFVARYEASISVTFYRLSRLANGNLVAFSRGALNIFTPELKPLSAVTRKNEDGDSPDDYWVGTVSSSGRTITVQATHQGKRSFEVRDAGSLAVISRWNDPLFPPPRFETSDADLVAVTRKQDEVALHPLREGNWYSLLKTKEPDCVNSAQFLPKGSLFVQTCGELKLFRSEEALFHAKKDNKNDFYERARADATETRLVISRTGLNRSKDRRRSTELLVYSLPDLRLQKSFAVDPVARTNYEYDISPSGNSAVALIDNSLKLFSLAEPHDASPQRK